MSWDDRRRNLEIGSVAGATAAALLLWTWVISSRDASDAPYFWIPFWISGGFGVAFTIPLRLRTSGLGLILGTLLAMVLLLVLLVIIMGSLGES